jgi:long-subunit fatty acid transport protein
MAQTLKAGAEIKITPQFAIRAGYVWQQTPMKSQLMNNTVEVYTAGTIPHFTTSDCTSYYTAGMGFRFTPNFYMDMAFVYRTQNEKLYPFSNMNWNYPEYHITPVKSEPATVTLNTTRLALTLGYKF